MTRIKTLLFAVVPALMLSTSAFAGDFLDVLSTLDVASLTDAGAAIDEAGLNGLDLDTLADVGQGDSDAIEACFRRFGYGGWGGYGCGYGHRTFGWGCYNHCYNYCYPTYYCYRPLYTYCMPVCHNGFWGCY